PYYPDYPGHLTGKLIHGISGGYHKLYRPEEDVRQITALYDSEVHYVDRFIGRLLESLDPTVRDNTLIVFTADHGEELYDHHGWKHGQTLYEEQIHVPLIFRWDRRLPPGRRLDGTVRLVDLVPTVMAALGQAPDPAWQGENLLPALEGDSALPRRPAFAQNLSSGPIRAASVLDREKLIFFNRRTPFDPPDKLQEHLWKIDLERMADVELYDLDQDPHEKDNLAAEKPDDVRRLAPVIHRYLDRRLAGLRLAVEGLEPGARLVARVRFEQPADEWRSYFLAPQDGVRLAGRELEVEWVGGPPAAPGRGVLIEGDLGAVTIVSATLDGEPMPASAIQVGEGRPYEGGALAETSLRAHTWPPAPPEGTVLRVWLPGEEPVGGEAPENAETRRRLKALGYL
ncbi:MAG: sulfatase-like hydrolase/transferase, partial [Acidobacteria bacterium]|nr:sulfatase-like hydrolase/transferase [Acidobacteriota bacterium]